MWALRELELEAEALFDVGTPLEKLQVEFARQRLHLADLGDRHRQQGRLPCLLGLSSA